MWAPDLHEFDGAIYTRIADALENDIRTGRLAPGTRLPTLKELAALVGVTPGTVNRAYELAQRRGLVEGEVGRGTFVLNKAARSSASRSSVAPTAPRSDESKTDVIDLSIVKPNLQLQEPFIRTALGELARSNGLLDMLDYTPDGGHLLHRQAGAAWMQASGFAADAEQVLLTAGAQHGLWVAVNALTQPGDLVLCESLCYPGVASVVMSLGRRIRGVRMDDEGMEPNSLQELCRQERPAMVICIATCQNPTTAVMSAQRRKDIAQIARDFDVILLDDDLYGFLAPTPAAPLATFAPERTVYVTSLSKSVVSTIRVGYIHCPPEWLPRMAASVKTSIWMVSPLGAQIASNLIMSGKAAEMTRSQRDEARVRQTIAHKLLGQYEYRSQPTSFHIWLKLPVRWPSGEHFAALARGHRLLIAGGDAFAVNRDDQGRQYVRIALMASDQERMRFVLTKLAGLISTPDSVWL